MSTDIQNHPPRVLLWKTMLFSSSLYSASLIFQRMASTILIPIYTRYLTPADFGTLEILDQTISFVSILLALDFSSALSYYYFAADSEKKRQTTVSTTLFGAAGIGVSTCLAVWLLASRISQIAFHSAAYVGYIHIVSITMGIGCLLEALLVWLRVEDRSGIYTGASALRVMVTVISAILLVAAFKLQLTGVFLAGLIGSSTMAGVLTVYCLRRVPLDFSPRLFVSMFRFSVPMAFTGAALFVIHFGDRFFLQHYRNLATVGIYGLAYKVGMLIGFVQSSFQSYWSAQMFQVLRRNDSAEVFARVFTYLITLLSFLGLALIFAARPLIELLTAPSFRAASALVPYIVVAYFIRAIGDFFRMLFVVEKRPELDAFCNWLGAGFCLAGYFLLIPRFGTWGAVAATTLTFLFLAVLVMPWTYRLHPYVLEGLRLTKIAVATVITFILWLILPKASPSIEICQSGVLLACFLVLLWAFRFPTPGERVKVRSAVAVLFSFIRRSTAAS
jgi:O-antigen/teichoic acid export membrane protein